MLIGHPPTGNLASTAVLDRLGVGNRLRQSLLVTGLVASVAPDLDLLYFYGVDHSVHHHSFPTHWPLLWLAVAASVLFVAAIRRSRVLALGSGFVGVGALLHLALDSVAGSVRWLAPWSDLETTLIGVPAQYSSWILSFVTHWTFGV